MEFLFPGVEIADFDFTAEWLIHSIDFDSKRVDFKGQGKNADLELSVSYVDYEEALEQLTLGQLVTLPYELFWNDETKQFTPDYECY